MIQSLSNLTQRYGTTIPANFDLPSHRKALFYIIHGGAIFEHSHLQDMRLQIRQPVLDMLALPQGRRLHRGSIFVGVMAQAAVDNALLAGVFLGFAFLMVCKGGPSASRFALDNLGVIYGSLAFIGCFVALATVRFLSAPLPVLATRSPAA